MGMYTKDGKFSLWGSFTISVAQIDMRGRSYPDDKNNLR